MAVRTEHWMNKPLTAEQQVLVMSFHKLTKGRGHTMVFGKSQPGKARKLADLKATMQRAGVPSYIIYGS